jgi:hypothetical protein
MSHIKLFEEKQVRSVWDAEKEKWYISIIDVIEILTETDRPRKYWSDLKAKLKKEGSELSEKIGQLKIVPSMENKILLFSNALGNVNIHVRCQNENFGFSQKAIAQLFGLAVPAISKHLANIYDTGELQLQATISILETVQQEGKKSVKRIR